jgi:glycosyltransferase involved in cell wall biosynthesis
MKLIYDVIGAPPGSGGSELHAREFLHAWAQQYPDDDLIVVGTRWESLSEEDVSRTRWINWPARSFAFRIIGQLLFVPLLMQFHRAHLLLVSVPVLSPLSPNRRSFVFAHDWRHLKNPNEFPILRRLYRSIWRTSVNRASITFCVSRKALTETVNVAPTSVLVLAENGRDHALRWSEDAEPSNTPVLQALPREADVIVTFGHWNNKRPELVIAALATLEQPAAPQLIVLGARHGYRESLRKLAIAQGISQRVHLPGFVPDKDYQSIMRRASCVVLASTDEGFGFPVAEGLSLGHPVVVTADSGIAQTFGDAVKAVPPEPDALGQAIKDALAEGRTARHQNSVQSWRDTAIVVREAIASTLTAR